MRRFRLNRGRPEGDKRGNNEDRARRKRWLLKTFGNGKTVACTHCGKKLTYDTLTADRIVPGCQGGGYTHANIQPSCKACNDARNSFGCELTEYDKMKQEMDKALGLRKNPKRRRRAMYRCSRGKCRLRSKPKFRINSRRRRYA